jgi:hypothetical protein
LYSVSWRSRWDRGDGSCTSAPGAGSDPGTHVDHGAGRCADNCRRDCIDSHTFGVWRGCADLAHSMHSNDLVRCGDGRDRPPSGAAITVSDRRVTPRKSRLTEVTRRFVEERIDDRAFVRDVQQQALRNRAHQAGLVRGELTVRNRYGVFLLGFVALACCAMLCVGCGGLSSHGHPTEAHVITYAPYGVGRLVRRRLPIGVTGPLARRGSPRPRLP